jgi:hypothetical protein
MHLSTVGFVHTLFGLVGVVVGIYMLVKYRKMDPRSAVGKTYLVAITISCILVFALPQRSADFNPTPGYVLTLLTLISLFLGSFIRFSNFRARRYIEALGLSGSLFFSMVPAINETLTRLPIDAPLASSPQDPIVLTSLGALAALFLALCVAQIITIRRSAVLAPG